MGFGVVCISRAIAAEGESIGEAVAQRLGFRYVDEQIITRAAQLAQVEPALVAASEHRQGLLRRIIDNFALAHELAGAVTFATGVPVDAFAPEPSGYRAAADDLRTMIRAAIHEVAGAGRAVIVAHAASVALRGTTGVLRVLVTASADTRAQRLATVQGMSAAAAAAAVAASDRERRAYFQRFYKVPEELPTHYDIVINTDALSSGQAVDVLVAAVHSAA